ncbi:MAG: peptide chain release factor N(5)-glutamine methyltransferase [Pseudomonadota bacterium]
MRRPEMAQTYLDVLDAATARLDRAGVDAPRREARLLLALAADLSPAALIGLERDELTDAAILARFEHVLARREAREPFAHIAGRRGFYGLDFISDGRALVPRPDSECVVDAALALLPRATGQTVVDLGTGSGCLLISILKARRGVTGVGVERSPAAAALARENLKRHDLLDRATIEVCSWKTWQGWGSADLVISNPPYIASADIFQLDTDVRAYEPITALDGGPDGLDAYREIVMLAAKGLRPGIPLVLEIGHDQKKPLQTLLNAHDFTDFGSGRDLGGRDRVVWARASHTFNS